jgi:hypothetical protein
MSMPFQLPGGLESVTVICFFALSDICRPFMALLVFVFQHFTARHLWEKVKNP